MLCKLCSVMDTQVSRPTSNVMRIRSKELGCSIFVGHSVALSISSVFATLLGAVQVRRPKNVEQSSEPQLYVISTCYQPRCMPGLMAELKLVLLVSLGESLCESMGQ